MTLEKKRGKKAMQFFQFHNNTPEKRRKYCAEEDGGKECHLTEAAVMIAFALYLLDEGANEVGVFPDGEHGKRFSIKNFLEHHGFSLVSPMGSTKYGGTYRRIDQTIIVNPKPGKGDVTSKIGGQDIFAECKGGAINSTHSGVQSRLKSGLCEVVGLLMARPLLNDRHIAVVPKTKLTEELSKKILPRAKEAGIEIALIDKNGSVHFVRT